jgi:hypothetical protein
MGAFVFHALAPQVLAGFEEAVTLHRLEPAAPP